MLNKKKIRNKLSKFLRNEKPTGFIDGLMFHKYGELLYNLKKRKKCSATLKHFLNRIK